MEILGSVLCSVRRSRSAGLSEKDSGDTSSLDLLCHEIASAPMKNIEVTTSYLKKRRAEAPEVDRKPMTHIV